MPSLKEDIEEFMKIPYDEVVSPITGSINDYRINLWTNMFLWGVKKDTILDYYRSDQYAATLFKDIVETVEACKTSMPQSLANIVAKYQVVELKNGVITDPRILYWGCGNAKMMFELIGMDKWNITLADVPGTYFQFLRYLSDKYVPFNKIRFIEIDKNNDRPIQPHRKYDIIICDGVLEHVLEPSKMLKYLCGHLEDMGHIYISSIFASDHLEPDPSNVSLILDTKEQKEKWNNLLDECGLKLIEGDDGVIWQKVTPTIIKPEAVEKKYHIYPTSIAFLSTLPGEKCGIATYTGWLSEQVGKYYPVKIFRDITDPNIPENAMIIASIEFGIFPITEYKETLLNNKFKDNWKFALWHTVIKDLPADFQTYIQDIDIEYDAHIVHTAIQKAWLSRYVTKPIYLIPHGTLLWEPLSKEEAKEKLGLSKDDKIAFVFGFAAENKGLQELIEAAKKVKTPNFKLVMSAGVHGIAAEYTLEIKNKLQKQAEDSNVTVLGKYLSDDEIDTWVSASDMLIFNYKTPPIVASASGAMKRVLASGKPIVCVSDNRLEELVEGQHCIKYEIGDINGLARAIDIVLSDPDMANRLGNNCRILAEQTSWQKTAEKLIDIVGSHTGEFGPEYYDEEYFVGKKGGKKFVDHGGNESKWSYYNPEGEWLGAEPIMKAIKEIFNPTNMLLPGDGRGTFSAYAKDQGIDVKGIDFSKWAVDHPYPRAKGLVQLGDVRDIKFPDSSFDILFVSDVCEHVYIEDLPKAISEIQRVAKKWIFYNIGASMPDDSKEEMVLRKNRLPPKNRQVTAVAGHVTVKPESWWREKISNEHWILRDDLVSKFRELVPEEALENWRCVLITEKVDEVDEDERMAKAISDMFFPEQATLDKIRSKTKADTTEIPKLCFDKNYYDEQYFADQKGKKFRRPDGSIDTFGYRNPQAEWLGCGPIVNAWNTIFHPKKMLDIACGRGTFITYARDCGIDAVGFDFSDYTVNNPYFRCNKDWISHHDATQTYPYPDNSFDFVTVLDFLEHVYLDDINKVLKEVYRVAGRYVFLLIATIGASSGVNQEKHDRGYVIKKGEEVPTELLANAASGHVTVCSREWWEDKLLNFKDNIYWHIRRDLEEKFRRMVPEDVLATWKMVIILEKDNKKPIK